MTDPKIENLARQDAEELTAEQAEEAQGGVIAVSHEILSSEEAFHLVSSSRFVNAGGNF